MALQGNNQAISLSDIQTEFGGTNPISMSEYYRNGSFTTYNNTNVPESGEVDMSNFYSGIKAFEYVVSSHTSNFNLLSAATSAGWNGTDPIRLTVNSGVYLWSSSFSSAGLIINSGLSGVLRVDNYGYIIGMGGNGGYNRGDGGAGGPAIRCSASGVVLNNFSGAYIAGGGGGGGAGFRAGGGGGAGGGTGGAGVGTTTGAGGAGGGVGSEGNSGGRATAGKKSEGSGGRAGGGGATGEDNGSSDLRMSGGGGGGRYIGSSITGGDGGGWREDDTGGDGGSFGNAGANGRPQYGSEDGGGGGGGWGARGGNGASGGSGGAGGAAIYGVSISVSNSGVIYGTY